MRSQLARKKNSVGSITVYANRFRFDRDLRSIERRHHFFPKDSQNALRCRLRVVEDRVRSDPGNE